MDFHEFQRPEKNRCFYNHVAVPLGVLKRHKLLCGDDVEKYSQFIDDAMDFTKKISLIPVVNCMVNYDRYIDSEPIEFNGDIIITDPCYIIEEADSDDWDMSCYGENLSCLGINAYMTRDTIYGDWSCTTFNSDTGDIIGRFCADSGMVSVISLDEVLAYNPSFNYHVTKPWTTTLIKNFKGTVQFIVKENKWTLDEDTSWSKKGDEFTDYEVEVVGHGENKVTGEPINFVSKQTEL